MTTFPKMRRLTAKVRMVLLAGPKASGSYNPVRALSTFEESMTGQEIETASAFLNWCLETGRTFGSGNIETCWAQWQKASQQ